MKKTLAWILALLLVSSALLLTACENGKSIVGTWVQVGENNTYIFHEDGTGEHNQPLHKIDITYTIDGDTITINDKSLGVIDKTETYTFEIDGDTLRLTKDDTTLVFNRQTAAE